MDLGICEQSFIPIRSSFSHRAEMVSQVLFGEIFEIISHRGEWLKIKLLHDGYEGYVEEASTTHLLINTEILLNEYDNSIICFEANNWFTKNRESILLPIGSKIPKTIITDDKFYINENSYTAKSPIKQPEIKDKRAFVIDIARSLINTPYLWGGRTGWGIDCSGLAQLAYELVGIKLPRDAYQQVSFGQTLNFISEAKPGDLAFFDNEDGEIIHVGIILENNSIIHASKYVKVDSIDHQGIYNKSLRKYTHNLRVIKSLI
ncbi:C40 family peptidase [Bacteroidales bacterium OttesenSCG-928-I21]|nr:C40 family peptidase [Bacteroidales bacterium OttesenSCG-928-I21]